MGEKKASTQLVWGLLLVLAGVGVVVKVHLMSPAELETVAGRPSSAIFFHICVYIMAILLIGGGVGKIRNYYKKDKLTDY